MTILRYAMACLVASLVLLCGVTAQSAAVSAEDVAAALAAGNRPAEDVARDAGRKPAEVVAFLGIAPGETVIDLIASGGYYTEVLSLAVGPSGKVYAQNAPFVLKLRDGANEKAISKRLAGGRLPNVERLDLDMSELGLAPASIDAAVTALNFHDIYNGRGPEAAASFLAAVKSLLKPGGVLGIVDHHGNAGADNQQLHRIEEKLVTRAAESAGFVVEASGELLRFTQDDRSKNVFDPSVRGKTDRFLLRLRKPGP